MINTIAGMLILIVLLWGAYSLFCVLLPLKPFGSRLRAAASVGLSFLALAAITIGLTVIEPEGVTMSGNDGQPEDPAISTSSADPTEAAAPEASSGSEIAVAVTIQPSEDIPAPCGDGGLALNDVVAVTGDHDLHVDPDDTSPKIKNEKASNALGQTRYHQIDNSTTVRRICAQSEWTEVQIVSPEWLDFVKGWVPNTALREIETNDNGSRKYVEDDFYWDEDTSEFKPQIVSVVNRIAVENRNCSTIDPSSVAKSPSRSKPGDPVFFVTCGTGVDVFNVWFRPSDAEGDQQFNATEPLSRNAAVNACEMAAKQAATHPSTVSFSRVWDLAYVTHASGRARVVSSFTAKNGLNLELKFRIDCLFDGPDLIETNISESLD
ncbi:hypothetical protein [Defluviimonas salinarum]|uniref:Uncharacterized protein n=1 Tax=Defluviimonas salinarum TaxID=2992147 RepID=A0ABT3JAK0_9RHOB|nr:hypothetical protein [Defluviimonas salinarum]MCW3784706.1 hypothetical protein [Defluviimonas salinarum]